MQAPFFYWRDEVGSLPEAMTKFIMSADLTPEEISQIKTYLKQGIQFPGFCLTSDRRQSLTNQLEATTTVDDLWEWLEEVENDGIDLL